MCDHRACFCSVTRASADEALAAFYKQWAGEMLCVTKWLTMQSCCELPGNTGAVEKLLSHPAFDLRSPNKCYALVGSFSRQSSPPAPGNLNLDAQPQDLSPGP